MTTSKCVHEKNNFDIILEIQVRLQGPESNEGVGRVEVFYQGEWGTICDDKWDDNHENRWDINDANVVCRQLGFSGAKAIVPSWKVPDGSGKVWLGKVACRGSEKSIARCFHGGWGKSYCSHYQDAGVECFTGNDKNGMNVCFYYF